MTTTFNLTIGSIKLQCKSDDTQKVLNAARSLIDLSEGIELAERIRFCFVTEGKIPAIKLYREITEKSLLESKNAVEEMIAGIEHFNPSHRVDCDTYNVVCNNMQALRDAVTHMENKYDNLLDEVDTERERIKSLLSHIRNMEPNFVPSWEVDTDIYLDEPDDVW